MSVATARLGALLLLCAWPLVAVAQENPYLEDARRLYASQRFGLARERLELARQVPSDDRAQKEQVLDLLARCYIAEGQRGEAQRAYVELLELSANWAPEADVSPKIRDVYELARAQSFPPGYVALQVEPDGNRASRIKLVDPWRRVRALLLKEGPRSERRAPESFRVGLAINAREPAWSVDALAEDGAVLQRWSSAPQAAPELSPSVVPGSATLPPAAPEPARAEASAPGRRWAAWLVAGLSVSAGVGAGVMQARSSAAAERARNEPWSDAARAHQARAVADADVAAVLAAGALVAGGTSVVLFVW